MERTFGAGGAGRGSDERRRRRLLAALVALLVLAALAGGAWVLMDRLAGGAVGTEPGDAPSEEVARGAEERIGAFLEGDPPATLRLDGAELRSLVELRIVPLLPPGVSRPAVALGDSTLEVGADVHLSRLPGDLAPALRSILGDSTRVVAELLPRVPRPGALRVRVLRLRAGDLPIPSMLVPRLLRELGPTAPDDPRSLEYRVADDLVAVEVSGGTVTLERAGPGGGG